MAALNMSDEVLDLSFNSNLSQVSTEVSESPGKEVNILEVKKEVEVEEEEVEGYFVVESVLDRKQDINGDYWYFVRWASTEEGREVWEESWTEEWNLGSGLKEEFEENLRRMEGDKEVGGEGREEVNNEGGDKGREEVSNEGGDKGREVNNECGDNGMGEERGGKRRRVDKKNDGNDGKGSKVKCTNEDCPKSFKNQNGLTQHLKRWCGFQKTEKTDKGLKTKELKTDKGFPYLRHIVVPRRRHSKLRGESVTSRVSVGSGGGGGVEAGAGGGVATDDVEMTEVAPVGTEVTQVSTPGTPPSTINTDDENQGAELSEFPPLPSMDEGNGMRSSQATPQPEEDQGQGRDELSATPSPPSSSSSASQFVEDGQMPSTSTSIIQTNVKIKVERNAEGGDVKPKSNGLDRGSLTAWLDAQDEKFQNLQARYQNEQLLRTNAQDKLSEKLRLNWELEKKVRKMLKDEEDNRKKAEEERAEIEEKLKEEEEKKKKAEEERAEIEEKLKEEEEKKKKAEEERAEIEEKLKEAEENRKKAEEEWKKSEEKRINAEEELKKTKEELLASQLLNDFTAQLRKMEQAANKVMEEVKKK